MAVLLPLCQELNDPGEAGVAAPAALGLVKWRAAAAVAGGEVGALADQELHHLE